MSTKSYTELIKIASFEDRYNYLKLGGSVGAATFGFERWANQHFYTSRQWKDIRYEVIARDEGMDLGVIDHEIWDRVIVHHMNPITPEDLENDSFDILDPEFLISTSHRTHNAIHYGDAKLLRQPFVERQSGDTRLWASN